MQPSRKVWAPLPVLILFIGLLGLSVARADPPFAMEYQVKAAFLYKFSLYVEWPENAFKDGNSPVVFGIAGPESLVAQVEDAVQGRTINGRPVEVRRVEGTNVEGLHLLFVAQSEQDRMQRLLSLASDQPTLLVTEGESGLEAGGVINFRLRDGRVRFDVDLDNAGQQGLRLSAQLLKVARFVQGAPS